MNPVGGAGSTTTKPGDMKDERVTKNELFFGPTLLMVGTDCEN